MKISGKSLIQRVINKVSKNSAKNIEKVSSTVETGGNVISLQERRAARDAFYKQAEKAKTSIKDIYMDDDAPTRIKPLIGPRGGHFDRHI